MDRTEPTAGDEPRVGHGKAAPGIVRGLVTLAGVAIAGFLVWLASQFDLGSTGGFWTAMAIIAGAGAVLGFSQLLGGWTKWGLPRMSPLVFLLGFLPTLLVGGGILLAIKPSGTGTQDTVRGWAQDLGIEGLVSDMGLFAGVIAFTIGLVFSFVFDTAGPRDRVHRREGEPGVADEDVHDYRRDDLQTVPDEDVHDYRRDEVHTRPADEGPVDRTDGVRAGARDDRVEIRDPGARRETP